MSTVSPPRSSQSWFTFVLFGSWMNGCSPSHKARQAQLQSQMTGTVLHLPSGIASCRIESYIRLGNVLLFGPTTSCKLKLPVLSSSFRQLVLRSAGRLLPYLRAHLGCPSCLGHPDHFALGRRNRSAADGSGSTGLWRIGSLRVLAYLFW